MRGLQKVLLFFGRVMISGMFLTSSVHKILNWQEIERGLVTLFCDLHGYSSFSFPLQRMFASLLPWVPLILVLITALELIGGLLLLLKIKVRLGAAMLILFTILITLLFHHFWFLEGPEKEVQMVFFIKNIAIIGGLLFVLVFGADIKSKSSILSSPEIHIPEKHDQ